MPLNIIFQEWLRDMAGHMVQFDIITLFPRMFDSPLQESIIKKAQQKGLINISVHDLRGYTEDKHKTTDDYPYGGGSGMVMKVEPIVKAIEAIKSASGKTRTILATPQGATFSQETAQRLSTYSQILIVCGRYEGVDERVLSFVDEEISIGDYVLTGGEIAVMVIIDTVARLVPGVVGDMSSVLEDTFSNSLLKYPQYTRPGKFRELEVPEVLVSGDHSKVKKWRRAEALKRTLQRRPDLLKRAVLTDEDREVLNKIKKSEGLEFENEYN
jgi:tRNA (guanine37-N1)-methyltransferase